MFNIILVSPEIPPNTGNIIRLAANTGANLHLIKPLGFRLENAKLKRAGLDYHEWAHLQIHDDLAGALQSLDLCLERCFAVTTKGQLSLKDACFQPGDTFIFGSETSGLSANNMALFPLHQRLRLPMQPNQRSLNLSNAVAVTVFEAWRQSGYAGGL